MRNKSTLAFILFLSIGFWSTAQVNKPSYCETVEKTDEEMEQLPWYGNNDYLDQIRDSAAFLFKGNMPVEERSDNSCPDIDGMLMIPIRFWIYRATDNDPAMPTDWQLQRMMDRLNFLFQSNGMNVRFFMVCPQYETNSDMVLASDWDTFWNSFGGANTDADAINVHIVEDYKDAGGVYNSVADLIVVERDIYTTLNGVSTLAHEIGHYFGLEHTHRNATKGKCQAEAVSRSRNFTVAQFFGCIPPKTGRICEKNGDALCDTPADPELIWGEDPVESKVDNNCNYNWNETDNWGDAYDPDETNIMSYAPRVCRTSFSGGQTVVMADNMLFGRPIFQFIDKQETDPDQYEPDDSDFPGVPRPIALGESQCHSFYDMLSCQDPADWLRMSLSQGVIGSYQIKIEKVDDAPNPVEKVKVWNIGSNGMRSTEVVTTSSTVGTTMIFEFPCSTSSNGSLLIEVERKSDVTEGKYKIILTSSIPLSISGSNILCRTASYNIEGVPSGATVSWTSSPSITLQNTSGLSVAIQNYATGTPPYWIEATIFSGSCSQIIRKTFSNFIGNAGIPEFFISTNFPACFPGGGDYSISNPVNGVTYSWDCDGIPCNGIQTNSTGTFASIGADARGTMTITVKGMDECGNSREKSFELTVEKCGFEMQQLVISPNPTTGTINVQVQDTYDTEGTYHVVVINQMSELKFQSDYSNKQFSINLGELQNGVYSILVYRGETSTSSTFIINN